MKTTITLLCFSLVLFTTRAQTIVRWDFEAEGVSTLLPTYIGDGSISANPLAYSGIFPSDPAFVVGASGISGDFSSIFRGWPISLQWDASDYLQFRFSIDAGTFLKVDSVSLWYKRSLSGPQILHFRSNKDNYTTSVDSVVVDESDGGWHKWVFPLDSFSVSGYEQVTFRLHGNGAVSSALGTLSVDSVAVYGEIIPAVEVSVKTILSGPWNGIDMSDSLRRKGLLPVIDPYGLGRETLTQVFGVSGNEAIVDWVRIQLRDSVDPGVVVAENAFLLQRDGDVVDVDGVSSPKFYVDAGQYHVAVFHRNHLGVVTSSTINLGDVIDFTSGDISVLGVEPLQPLDSLFGLWEGDVNRNGAIKYSGVGNDRDIVLLDIGGILPTNVESGYFDSDVNMDGLVKYAGSLNDRDPILLSIGGVLPTNIRAAQIP